MRTGNRARRGSALLTVLWLTAALAAIGLAVANNVRGETERAATNVEDAKAYFLARGAVQRAALHVLWGRQYLTEDGRPMYQPVGDPVMNLSFPAGEVHVDLIPEASKLSVNDSPPRDLLRLLMALGVPEDRATETTQAILDWRTPYDPLHQGPFDAFYLSQTPSFRGRHASFLENEEMLQVKGITPEIYYGSPLGRVRTALRDCLSVYGSSGAVDINTAQPETLLATGLAPQDVAAIVKLRATHTILDQKELAEIVTALGPSGSRLQIGGRSMFTLRATARLRQPDGKLSDMRRTTGALVKFNFPGSAQNRPVGFEVMRWFDRT